MTTHEFLAKATRQLAEAGIKTARLDVLVLLEDVLHKERAYLLAHADAVLGHAQYATLNKLITQREKHVPLAYIRGKVAFYGREFAVNQHVLVPRPETEAVIDLLLKTTLPTHPRVADIGTGSGCIGITAALELPQAAVYLYDIDAAALKVAKQNALHYGTHVSLWQQDLLQGCGEDFDVILANLPYVPNDYPVNQAAKHEPKLALYSGDDGLDHYRRLWRQVASLSHKPDHIILEVLPAQHNALKLLAQSAGYSLTTTQDFAIGFARSAAPHPESPQ